MPGAEKLLADAQQELDHIRAAQGAARPGPVRLRAAADKAAAKRKQAEAAKERMREATAAAVAAEAAAEQAEGELERLQEELRTHAAPMATEPPPLVQAMSVLESELRDHPALLAMYLKVRTELRAVAEGAETGASSAKTPSNRWTGWGAGGQVPGGGMARASGAGGEGGRDAQQAAAQPPPRAGDKAEETREEKEKDKERERERQRSSSRSPRGRKE
jgi:hypothetical protein